MRLFVALNLPTAERRRIHRAAAPLREAELPVRWVSHEQYHLTLRFLGEVERSVLEAVTAAVRLAAERSTRFEARLAGFGAFPTPRNPRVLWLGVEASPPMRSLKQDLDWALSEVGIEREARAFHPHVTLGRSSDSGRAGAFRVLEGLTSELAYEGKFEVKALDLMRSQLGPEGSRYSVVSSSTLNTGG